MPFKIQLTDKKSDLKYDKPFDELGEFSSFEMGLLDYFYENNYWVKFIVGTKELEVPMYTDIAYMFGDIPPLVYYLSQQKKGALVFAEFNAEIKFQPKSNQVQCIYRYNGVTETALLSFEEIIIELKTFAMQILKSASEGAYITSKDIKQYWELPPFVYL